MASAGPSRHGVQILPFWESFCLVRAAQRTLAVGLRRLTNAGTEMQSLLPHLPLRVAAFTPLRDGHV